MTTSLISRSRSHATTVRPTGSPREASPAQVSYLASLIRERQYDPASAALEAVRLYLAGRSDLISSGDCSYAIKALQQCSRKPQPATEKANLGYYVTSQGTVYHVVSNKAGTGVYAKVLVVTGNRATWEYAPGVGRSLAADGLQPLTVDEAARLGHQHGVCVVCARTLTDPESVERGIGPVCARTLA